MTMALPGLFCYLSVFYGCFSIAKISRNNRIVPEDTKQINKIHPFINERNFDKITFVINFRIGVRTKNL